MHCANESLVVFLHVFVDLHSVLDVVSILAVIVMRLYLILSILHVFLKPLYLDNFHFALFHDLRQLCKETLGFAAKFTLRVRSEYEILVFRQVGIELM